MTRINLKTDRLTADERKGRKSLRDAPIKPSDDPRHPDIYTKVGFSYKFKMKKPKIDAQGSIDAFYFEEGMRQSFFYPYLKKGIVVFDIGACHGSWTLPALAFGAQVFSFEPDPRWGKGLINSVLINRGFRKRFRLVPLAVADENYDSVTFDELEDVRCITVDEFVKRSGIKPDYIKIDTEGMELRIVAGAAKTLESTKPYVFIEHHLKVGQPGSEIIIIERLLKMGYKYNMLRNRTEFNIWSFFSEK